ncbi:MAG: hypothetical protein L6R37_001754 [Teloschistes peruensis]|nr:MAG: hypothetical protein L6R37_001754 [Teloschistes peruensis]
MRRRQEVIARFAAIQTRPNPYLCRQCLHKRLASTAIATADLAQAGPIEPPPSGRALPQSTPSASLRTTYKIKASVLLSRPPLLTRSLTPFEKAFFLYQKRLNERLALPFTRYFYYQKGTPGDVEWKQKIRERLTPARDIGRYNAYGKEGWNDELLIGAQEAEPENQLEALVRDAEAEVKEGEGEERAERGQQELKKEAVQRPMPRVTEADRVGDMKSLDRRLERTLYLVVKEGKERGGRWWFPSDVLTGKESLHTAAERVIVHAGGVNMNTWVVGNIPQGHFVLNYGTQDTKFMTQKVKQEIRGEKFFFMKGRIMAGQANLTDNKLGLTDFQWLAKDEIQKLLTPRDWNAVRLILAER